MISSYQGVLNPSSNLDLDNWGATLVCDTGNNHARIVFEMIKVHDPKPPKHFFRIAELCGTKITDLKNLKKTCGDIKKIALRHQLGKVILSDEKPINKFIPQRYCRKSATYVAAREKIEALIEDIQEETSMNYPYILAGRKSFLSRNADVFKIYDPLLAQIESVDQDLFIRLYDSAQNECLPTGMSEEKFNDRIRDAFDGSVEYSYKKLVKLFDKEMIFQTTVRQQSCFTWAKMKLESIGGEFTDLRLDKIISVTRLHLTNRMHDEVGSSSIDSDTSTSIVKNKKSTIQHSVTYDVKRDRRTEAWKNTSNEFRRTKNMNNLAITTTVVGGLGVWGAVGGGIAAGFGLTLLSPILLPTLAVGGAVGGATLMTTSLIAGNRAYNKKEEIKHNSRLNKDAFTKNEYTECEKLLKIELDNT